MGSGRGPASAATAAARSGTRSATATSRAERSRVNVSRYCDTMLPHPMMPTRSSLTGSPTAAPAR